MPTPLAPSLPPLPPAGASSPTTGAPSLGTLPPHLLRRVADALLRSHCRRPSASPPPQRPRHPCWGGGPRRGDPFGASLGAGWLVGVAEAEQLVTPAAWAAAVGTYGLTCRTALAALRGAVVGLSLPVPRALCMPCGLSPPSAVDIDGAAAALGGWVAPFLRHCPGVVALELWPRAAGEMGYHPEAAADMDAAVVAAVEGSAVRLRAVAKWALGLSAEMEAALGTAPLTSFTVSDSACDEMREAEDGDDDGDYHPVRNLLRFHASSLRYVHVSWLGTPLFQWIASFPPGTSLPHMRTLRVTAAFGESRPGDSPAGLLARTFPHLAVLDLSTDLLVDTLMVEHCGLTGDDLDEVIALEGLEALHLGSNHALGPVGLRLLLEERGDTLRELHLGDPAGFAASPHVDVAAALATAPGLLRLVWPFILRPNVATALIVDPGKEGHGADGSAGEENDGGARVGAGAGGASTPLGRTLQALEAVLPPTPEDAALVLAVLAAGAPQLRFLSVRPSGAVRPAAKGAYWAAVSAHPTLIGALADRGSDSNGRLTVRAVLKTGVVTPRAD
ncbi:hypothetical protein I4F81_004588 [Pyropia yezoensis]|uniref:Uncharacterized protein n=1 Tax=Pyropia yezoensis TaxID=2788 RepID=A0ACC3BVU4_PYRYE|nr:hypothetical protein I4F81_004588 [Neopyropia yezoensis]